MDLPKGSRTWEDLKCPLVQSVRRGRASSVKRSEPRSLSITFDPTITMDELQKFWVLSAVKACDGNITRSARMLNVTIKTVYNWLHRIEDETK